MASPVTQVRVRDNLMKTRFLLALIAVGLITLTILNRRPARTSQAENNVQREPEGRTSSRLTSTPAPPLDPILAGPSRALADQPPVPSVSSMTNTRAGIDSRTAAAQPQPSRASTRDLQDPLAREALALVGTGDPAAEDYWLEAIFDTNLPDEEREDLMEDLNEQGLADPRHPLPTDYPLILNRLAIIEEVAPQGDEFMQVHLAEAYKDLVNLLSGRGPN